MGKTRKLFGGFLSVIVLVGCAVALELREDQPPVPPSRRGDISGVLRPAWKVSKLSAVCRATGRRYPCGRLDEQTGRFTIEKLPGDATYDLCLETVDGRIIEGIDLDFVDARLLRLAEKRRKELGLLPERRGEFRLHDVKELLAYVRRMKDFMETRRVLYLRGHGMRATMLVELLRRRRFHGRRGNEVVWRIELWYFENRYGGWERLANQQRVLRRERLPVEQWRKINVEYDPRLSVRVEADGRSRSVLYTVPDQPDPSRGRVAGTSFELNTMPHVDGVEGFSLSATQPATTAGW